MTTSTLASFASFASFGRRASAEAPLDDEVRAKTLPRPLSYEGPLAGAKLKDCLVVVGLSLEADLLAWLGAVGISRGEQLTLLRRGAFGGPLHVRTASGGEFALNVALAKLIVVRSLVPLRFPSKGPSNGPSEGQPDELVDETAA